MTPPPTAIPAVREGARVDKQVPRRQRGLQLHPERPEVACLPAPHLWGPVALSVQKHRHRICSRIWCEVDERWYKATAFRRHFVYFNDDSPFQKKRSGAWRPLLWLAAPPPGSASAVCARPAGPPRRRPNPPARPRGPRPGAAPVPSGCLRSGPIVCLLFGNRGTGFLSESEMLNG
jgi:hypothetical protein